MNTKMVTAIAVVLIVVVGASTWAFMNMDNSEDLPVSFDQRDQGLITPVKYQNPWGTCWAFGATGAAETSILTLLHSTYDKTKLDLSEKHLAWFGTTYITPVTSQSQQYEGLYVLDSDNMYGAGYGHGGDSGMILTVYAQAVGPVYEKDFPYMGNTEETALEFYSQEGSEDVTDAIEKEFEKENDGVTIEDYLEAVRESGKMKEFIEENIESGLFPEDTTEDMVTTEFYVECVRLMLVDKYTETNEYFSGDNWSLSEFDRGQVIGYILWDGNVLPDLFVKNNHEQWTGLSDYGMSSLKSELIAGHGVFGAYNANDDYYNEDTAAYFSLQKSSNHEIQIIGWDDNFDSKNFKTVSGKAPEGNGAWLCKNSWGSADVGYEIKGQTYYSDWGIKDKDGKGTGYFWISYYDRSIQDVNSLVFTDKVPTKDLKTYMYDYMPSYSGLYTDTSKDVIKTSNIFTADGNDKITSINVRSTAYGSTVKVTIYKLGDGKITDPTDGKEITKFQKIFTYGGYHTVILDTPIELTKGDVFSIVCEETNPNIEDKEVHLFSIAFGPDKQSAEDLGSGSYVVGIVNEGESLLYIDGKWMDLAEYIKNLQRTDYRLYDFDNFSIKAYAQSGTAAES